MVTASVSTAITRNILSFQDLETKLNLKRSLEADFFREWQEDLAPLNATETETIRPITSVEKPGWKWKHK